jgi:uncharacterized paraquat-inducible protein A
VEGKMTKRDNLFNNIDFCEECDCILEENEEIFCERCLEKLEIEDIL